MADIIPLRDTHEQARSLMPWYLNGALAAEEASRMEAHLSHCAECRADLASERVLAWRIQRLPADLGRGWATLRGRLDRSSPDRGPMAWLRRVRRPWAIAALASALALAGSAAWLATPRPLPGYRALGVAEASRAGGLLVVIRPDTSEQAFRELLRRSGARVADGPTADGAYVLRVEPGRRAEVLAELRADASVVTAEPLRGGTRS
jgi:anti-sigma factor RsiW